ncbi:SsgA family sporulation/cell division regulator [Streptacidiphilus sp. PB12-B1b]|uniref:SsgA family sporulation/cell division regulator n=1 Tax=Streptacidiphilus sp. PB12-B1b TaxID=2705012 RepID=UPI0015FD110B|nr:SsgA family sporulation/cell division regulator [Streptacidiphilus sp. PB12-B1b]QMU77083.1 SsgA family sporulation/cell division regulator [Streptacidiphilus sp. PB12-B1b]
MLPTIIRPVDFTLLGPSSSIDFTAWLSYAPNNPFCVRARFPGMLTADGADAVWEFSRDLLTEGLTRTSGEGDVQVSPVGRDRTAIRLRTAQARAELVGATEPLRTFLQASYALVPFGRERLDLDWDRLLAAGSAADPQEPQ